jgi:type II secretory pathway pseudopilin PulG
MTRRGMTLIEGLVAFSLFTLVATLAWDHLSGAGRQARQVEEASDLVRAALILQEHLTTDLERALALRVLPEELAPRGSDLAQVVLPLYARYQGDGARAVVYRPVEYRFDPAAKRVLRDGRAIVGQGLETLRFRWTAATPTMLEVELTGEHALKDAGTRLTLRLPAPQGTDGLPIWVFAEHHREAEVLGASEEEGRGQHE